MKISKSKQELASIISENGGWRDGSEWAIQNGDHGRISFSENKPSRNGRKSWMAEGGFQFKIEACKPIGNWHQTILSRAEYFHLYPETDADGWIEWKGGDIPVCGGIEVDVRFRCGEVALGKAAGAWQWQWFHGGWRHDVIAYRLHKPEQAQPQSPVEMEFDIIQKGVKTETKSTIEQLAADYRNRKDYADRKQEEADAANAEAEAKLAELVAAGKALNLVISVAEKESELVITDWRDLLEGDVVWYGGDDELSPGEYHVMGIETKDYEGYLTVLVNGGDGGHWVDTRAGWGFILRP